MKATDWFRNWLYGLDDLTGTLEKIVYGQIPHLGSLLHYIRFFYFFAAPMGFAFTGLLILKREHEVVEILNSLLLFLGGGGIDALANLFSYHVKVLIMGFICFCFITWAANLFEDYVKMSTEKSEKRQSKRYLSPIVRGKVNKKYVKLSVMSLYFLCVVSIVLLYLISHNTILVMLVALSVTITLTNYYLPKFLQRCFKAFKKSTEAGCDFLQNYLYLVPALYASWRVFRPISEMPLYVHLLIQIVFIACYYGFQYMDWEDDRKIGRWTLANLLPKKSACFLGFMFYFMLVPFGLMGSSVFSHMFIKSIFILGGWALSCLFLGTFYKKPMVSLHGAYAMLCSYPVLAGVYLSINL